MKKIISVQASATECGRKARFYLAGEKQPHIVAVCALPKGHVDAPLLSKQITHHDSVYGLSWKGRGK